MRGAGRAERTVTDGMRVVRMLERHADKPVENLAAVIAGLSDDAVAQR